MSQPNEMPAALAGCIEACERCASVVRATPSEAFSQAVEGESSVGSHLRHCIEHFQCFLSGLPEGVVKYDSRARDARLESEPAFFLDALDAVHDALANIRADNLAQSIQVVQTASNAGGLVEAASTVARELVFLSGHTIHHLALVNQLLRSRGIAADGNIATAFSTAAYQRAAT